jgi:hypothetical protein
MKPSQPLDPTCENRDCPGVHQEAPHRLAVGIGVEGDIPAWTPLRLLNGTCSARGYQALSCRHQGSRGVDGIRSRSDNKFDLRDYPSSLKVLPRDLAMCQSIWHDSRRTKRTSCMLLVQSQGDGDDLANFRDRFGQPARL